MLSLNNIAKSYKKTQIIASVTQDFGKGVTLITGPSGVGKSTLLRICASVESPSSGELSWNNKSVKKQKTVYRKTLGYAPQQIDFPDDITANEFMLHVGALKLLSVEQISIQTASLFKQLGLTHDGDKKLVSFSGGMKRRLGIAQAFLGQPQCVILDEPTAELDPITAQRVHNLIFSHADNTVLIMTTHLVESMSEYSFASFALSPLNLSSDEHS